MTERNWRKDFDFVWTDTGSAGEEGDVEKTAASVRSLLSTLSGATVTLRVGALAFGERVLGRLTESERDHVELVVTVSPDRAVR